MELDGAKLTLLDASGKEIDSWTSMAGESHLIEGLAIGATYTLREDIAPYGYLISNTVKFTVGDTAEIQRSEVGIPEGFQFFGEAEKRGRSNQRFERRAFMKDEVPTRWTASNRR